jgi:hypothetical protein
MCTSSDLVENVQEPTLNKSKERDNEIHSNDEHDEGWTGSS